MWIRLSVFFAITWTQAMALAAVSGDRFRTSIVTGANGYLGKAIVHQLLENDDDDDDDKNHQVVLCLVRSNRVESESRYWKDVAARTTTAATTKVQVLPYDMTDGGKTLQDALDNADGEACCVYHVASNFGPTENHEQTALDNVQGAEALVQTLASHCLKPTGATSAGASRRPHKLVLTSSMAAVRGTGQDPKNGQWYTFEDWNVLSVLGANWGASYQWSKAESERRARNLAMETTRIPIVTLCPSFIFGPPHDSKSSTSFSLELVGQWVRGESPVQSRLFVDIRDVAAAHVAAGRRPEANGKRYIVSTEARVPSQDIAGWLSNVCRETGLADPDKVHFDDQFSGGAIPIGQREVEAVDRLRDELGVELRPLEETIADMAKMLLQSSPAPTSQT